MADGQVTPDPWEALREITPARIALGHAGGSLPTRHHLAFQLDHARARDAVHHPMDLAAIAGELEGMGLPVMPVRSAAADRGEYLRRPDLGRRLAAASRARLQETPGSGCDVVFVVADGLSPRAVQRHAPPALRAAVDALRERNWTLGPLVVVEQGRVAIGDEIGVLLGAGLVVVLLGERPGLSSPESLGAYLTHDPRPGRVDSERNCISNIRPEGLPPVAAARRLVWLLTEARRRGLTGVKLRDESPALPSRDDARPLPPG